MCSTTRSTSSASRLRRPRPAVTHFEVVEPLGSEILLNVTVAGQQVVCRVEPSVKAKPHEKIRMAFVPERIHFFDTKTEAVIK